MRLDYSKSLTDPQYVLDCCLDPKRISPLLVNTFNLELFVGCENCRFADYEFALFIKSGMTALVWSTITNQPLPASDMN